MREVALAPLACTVDHEPDGAPILVDRDGHISISHDGACSVAVLADGPCGVDLCLRRHRARTEAILRWLRIECNADPVAQFAALEAVLKLRRLGITRLLDRDIVLVEHGGAIIVRGIGDDVRVQLHDYTDFVVAVCG